MNPPSHRRLLLLLAVTAGAAAARAGTEEFFERLQSALTVASADATVRARASGTFDFEAYRLPTPAPGLLDTTRDTFVSPRLSLYLDAQLGPRVYAFAQARVDRGFDGGDGSAQARLDEYALRLAPWRATRASFQLGKFATLVGSWVNRHGSWENPFITAPLPYEHATGVWDNEPPRSVNQLLLWSHVRPGLLPALTAEEKQFRLPVIWGPAYGTGVAASAAFGRFIAAVEVKNSAVSSRPDSWGPGADGHRYPAYSARLAWSPNAMWRLGVSGTSGQYLLPSGRSFLFPGTGLGDYRQRLLGFDAGFAWHHWQLWAEVFRSRFALPRLGDATTDAAYVEAKYRFTPHFSAAVRLNRQTFGTLADGPRGLVRWGGDTWRYDVAPAWRLSPHLQLKLQASWQHEAGVRPERTRTWSSQFTLRF